MTEIDKIARIIIGPRNPVPENSLFSLELLQELRWNKHATESENQKLWIQQNIFMNIYLECLHFNIDITINYDIKEERS